jgi:hypothetical protein
MRNWSKKIIPDSNAPPESYASNNKEKYVEHVKFAKAAINIGFLRHRAPATGMREQGRLQR